MGSPSLADATVTLLLDDGSSVISARSGDSASYSLRVDKDISLPIHIQVEGGTDLLTGQPNNAVLSALSFDNDTSTLSITQLSSLAAEMAACNGTPDAASLDSSWQRIRQRTGLATGPNPDSPSTTELAALMRANLSLAEAIERTRNALAATSTTSAEAILASLACDLADDARLNLSAGSSSARLVGIFRAAETSVLLELIADTPYMDGQLASAQIDELLRQVSGDPNADMNSVLPPAAMIGQVERNLALLRTEFDDGDPLELLISLFAGDPRSTVAAALTTSRLTDLWALPERIALADSSTIDNLASSMTAQTNASTPIVSLSADPEVVDTNGTSRLSWAASDADDCTAAGAWSGNRAIQGSETSPSLDASTDFRLHCAGLGGLAVATVQVAVVDADTPPVVSLSADDATLIAGQATTIRWTSRNATACTAAGAWSGGLAVVGSRQTGSLNSTSDYSLTCTGPGGSDSATLRITVESAPEPAPTLSLSASPGSITSGASAQLTWSSSNATSCQASGGWSGSRSTTGSQSTGPLNSNSSFQLTCTGPGGSISRTTNVSVNSAPAPAPTLSLSASPSSITSGASSQLTWSSSNATSCQASGGWSGSQSTTGSESTGSLNSNGSFELTCTGPGGNISRTASVSVSSGPAPDVNLSASSTLVNAGGSATLSWSSSNASNCTASGGWSGSRSTTGSEVVGPLNAQTTFSLSCSGSGGTALDMVAISVNGNMSLNWVAPTENVDGSNLTDLDGYRVYYGQSSRNYTNMVDVADQNATSVSIALPSGDYYVAMTALDAQGNESAYSNEVLKTVQ